MDSSAYMLETPKPERHYRYWNAATQGLSGGGAVALLTLVCFRLHLNLATVACLYLITIVLVSLWGSLFSSAVTSLIAVGCLAYYFASPTFSFRISDPFDIVAVTAIFVTSTVITTLVSRVRKSAAELQYREMYLAEFQRLSRTGGFGWRVSTGEILWSEESFRIFQYDQTMQPSVEMVLQRIHPEDAARVKQIMERASRDGKEFDFESRLLMPEGSVKYVHIVAHAVSHEPGNVEFIGAVMEVTERRRAEEELRNALADLARVTRVTTLGELTASIAHEVNQPLTAIVTNGNTCLRRLATEPPKLEGAREAVVRMIRDGHRASEVVGRIRSLVKKTPSEKEWLNINEILREVIALVESELQRHRVSLQTQFSEELPPVCGDRIQLQQVILNLMMNGIEAMDGVSEGTRELLVCSSQQAENGVRVMLCDSGIGLESESLGRLFDAFYTTKSMGMGMGLAISRTIIEAHGGRLWAEPNVPQGAIFQFTLPVDDAPYPEGHGES